MEEGALGLEERARERHEIKGGRVNLEPHATPRARSTTRERSDRARKEGTRRREKKRSEGRRRPFLHIYPRKCKQTEANAASV